MSFENNGNNNNDKNEKGKLYKFLDKQGFYLILLLCVSIVMVTAIWVSRQEEEYLAEDLTERSQEAAEIEVSLIEDEEEVEEVEDEEVVASPGGRGSVEIVESPKADKPQEVKPQKQELEKQEPEKQQEVEPQETSTAARQQIMTQPVVGQIGLPFAMDKLVYHETLDHWSVHRGIDIHAEEGAPVRAVLDGEVVEVLNDTVMGITITLQHEEEFFTRYSNLSTDAMVNVGQKVNKGQVISGVGRTASIKREEGSLLHFQVIEGEKFVDPENYLPKID